ncbi:hypothetical protein TWF506_001944 [Arthrobotrys conoides]|uniref:Uncharacterized protein n=1 Tax=Arthrobotrys conoides TaxID=74498 RepID=A0AAN8P3P8_9PEZI
MAVGFTLGAVIKSDKTPATAIQTLARREDGDENRQIYYQYPVPLFINPIYFDNGSYTYGIDGDALWQAVVKAVQNADDFWRNRSNIFCTTFWKHDTQNKVLSQASIFCEGKISIQLINRRTGMSDGSPGSNVRVLCKDAVSIAVETVKAIKKNQHRAMESTNNDEKQRRLTTSVWSGDTSWSVDITSLRGECPPADDTIQNVDLSLARGDIQYIEPGDRKTLADVGSFPAPSNRGIILAAYGNETRSS